jgi:membrane-associated phospholipid phosphatase
MDKILAALPWAVGIGLIFLIAGFLVRRVPQPEPVRAGRRRPPARRPRPGDPPVTARQAVRDAWPSVLRFLVIIAAGTVAIWGVMSLLGLIVIHAGPSIDHPVYNAIMSHHEHLWKALMTRLTKIGDTWTIRGAALTAAVCLAVTWRRMKWLPPLALVVMEILQRLLTGAIHHTIHRVGPPLHLHGTFPSGGSERCVVFYGLIAYLLWREFSGSRRAAIWSGAVVAALAFNEGYSRLYLGMHWLTDVLSGWIYGCLLLALFIIAVHMVAGPARRPRSARAPGAAAAAMAGTGPAIPARPRPRRPVPAGPGGPGGNGTATRPTASRPGADRPAADRPAASRPVPPRPRYDRPSGAHPAADHPAADPVRGTRLGGNGTASRAARTEPATTEPATTEPARTEPAGNGTAGTDLSATDLSGTDLSGTDLSGTDLSGNGTTGTEPGGNGPADSAGGDHPPAAPGDGALGTGPAARRKGNRQTPGAAR